MPVWTGGAWEERCVRSRRQKGKLQLRKNTVLEKTIFLFRKGLERNVKRSDGHKEKIFTNKTCNIVKILNKIKNNNKPAIQLKRFPAFWVISTSLTQRLFPNIFHFSGSRRVACRKVLCERRSDREIVESRNPRILELGSTLEVLLCGLEL